MNKAREEKERVKTYTERGLVPKSEPTMNVNESVMTTQSKRPGN